MTKVLSALVGLLALLVLWDRWDRRVHQAHPGPPERLGHPAYRGPMAVPDLPDPWGRGVLPEPLAWKVNGGHRAR